VRQPLVDRPANFGVSPTSYQCIPLHKKIITARAAANFTIYLQPVRSFVGEDFEQAVMAGQVLMQMNNAF
jgi:hypothetical protein